MVERLLTDTKLHTRKIMLGLIVPKFAFVYSISS
jgi:hypothetical protein